MDGPTDGRTNDPLIQMNGPKVEEKDHDQLVNDQSFLSLDQSVPLSLSCGL